MSAHVSIQREGSSQLHIELRQGEGEVVRFGLFVLATAAGIYAVTPDARRSPGPLIATLLVAATWSAIAFSARESYTIDAATNSLEAARSTLLGRRRKAFDAREIVGVRLSIGGPDDNRRLVELLNPRGAVLLRLPWRITTLGAVDQEEVGQAIADFLGLPLRGRGVRT